MGVRGYGWKSSAEGGVRGAENSTQYPGARRRAGRGEEEKRKNLERGTPLRRAQDCDLIEQQPKSGISGLEKAVRRGNQF